VAFPRRLLAEGEEVVVDLRPHWAFLGWPLVAFVGAGALAIGVDVAFSPVPAGVGDVLLGVVAVAALWFAGRLLRWRSTSLALTSMRIVERSGVFGRRALEIRLDRINELSFHQSLAARLGRTGEVMVEVGGEAGMVMFEHVPRPSAFQSLITQEMTAFHQSRRLRYTVPTDPIEGPGAPEHAETPPHGVPTGPAPSAADGSWPPAPLAVPTTTAATGAPPTVADRLMQLGELRRRGIVSAAEFEAKKAELLEQL
jgi:hypothetical protein